MSTVLVIDENRATLATIARALREAGFSVTLTGAGLDGPRAGRHGPDLPAADVRLSDVANASVLAQLRQTLADVPVIVTGPRPSPRVIRALHIIEHRYNANLQVGTVAHDLGISTEHLCRTLKRHTGLTFAALLRRARVREACRLLHTTTLSMKEIAGRAGFSSASRFNRDFKTVCCTSPSLFRSHPSRP